MLIKTQEQLRQHLDFYKQEGLDEVLVGDKTSFSRNYNIQMQVIPEGKFYFVDHSE